MRMPVVVSLLAVPLVLLAAHAAAAPALGDKPVRYEYAELGYARVARGGPAGGQFGGPAGNPGGAPVPARTSVRWTTGEEEVEVAEWSELADRLKAPAPKKDSPESVHRLRVFNKLSADGWELLDRPLGEPRAFSGTGWSFRRRVP